METPIKAMYQAAKVNIPAQGDRVTTVANTLAAELSTLDRQASHAGDPAALVSLLHVGGDMHSVLKVAVDSLDNMAAALIAVKAAVLFGLARLFGVARNRALKLGLLLSQGGEFGFVLFAVGVGAGVMSQQNADLLAVVVTLSMAATPLLLRLDTVLAERRVQALEKQAGDEATDADLRRSLIRFYDPRLVKSIDAAFRVDTQLQRTQTAQVRAAVQEAIGFAQEALAKPSA